MHIKRSVENEKVYNEWVKAMNQINDSESKEVILLPSVYSFEPVGMCGSSGLVKVFPSSLSSPTTITNSCSELKF
jgi:hypothetical protein